MLIELGHLFLSAAFAVSLLGAFLPVLVFLWGERSLMQTAVPLTYITFTLLFLSFLIIVHAHIVSDFSVLNVVENSHSEKPMLYKIIGVWGNHEGSMLLWVLSLAFFSTLVALFSQHLPEQLKALILVCQSWMTSAFLLFILFMSNPFLRVNPPALQGKDLNPLLQDIALAIHPPLLYLGYVGFSLCFSFAVAALIMGYVDRLWARWVRPWLLLAWCFLTLGIMVGSYWAYYELGWGGYWFWDPVENVSFMPWLSGTALLHSALALEKRGILKSWTLFLSILTFSLSLMGTFLVRSGLLISVHSFALDPARGRAILALLLFFTGGALSLFALRVPVLTPGRFFQPISREGFIILNNLLLTTITATVLIGTLYPYFIELLTGQKISVGADFFNLTCGPLMMLLLLLVPFGSMIAWKRGDFLAVFERLWVVFALVAIVCFITFYVVSLRDIFAILGIGLSTFVFLGSLAGLWAKSGHRKIALLARFKRFIGLPWSVFGAAIAHMGLGVTLFGIIYVATFGQERILIMHKGDMVTIADKTLHLNEVHDETGPNYSAIEFHFTIYENKNTVGNVTASKRFYPSQNTSTTEVGIQNHGLSQLYIVPGRIDERGLVLHIWWKPYIICVWLGALMMAMGGCFSLFSYWFRIRVHQRRVSRFKFSEKALR
ncbi:cytochrome C biogenesis protein CcmF [Bartonella henselae]|uniref:Cytochrome c-type biogenesis protein CycK n=2 Tax=Bartonella TaxID=773 RepID=X5LSP6_BARHN|nr:heme lyase CcmF/NrfE family subunit [Bartonella henselae]MDM9997248.1 heme lyase CcmF/NrfE family subunit [Bartonella henselae]OLL48470.1 cytochrome C biogenesis protein CcmF [Bartonella henselae]OLL48798.1 cytochrome C biogenesis protein CcmF [Bartonella henselae]OLL49891.1 cytochrome C biogenesis protein CcmF [Bartonella henselae]OLL57445.1 cytochrome C biogenesis protein CcmF [Bartonella henselae]